MILDDNSNIKQPDKAGFLSLDSADLLSEKEQAIEALTRVVESKSEVISAQKKRIDILEEALRLSKIKRFAPSSEQSQQTSLFDEAENEVDSQSDQTEESELELEDDLDASTDEGSEDEQTKAKKKPGRKPFSDKLPRKQIYIYLTDAEKQGSIDTFFTKVKEELDIIPAKVRVLEYMQEKAVFTESVEGENKRKVKSALMPRHPVSRAMGSVSLMCFVLVAKYADGLPLYRQEGILSRYGGEISRATLANWIIALAKQLQPLINLMREHQHKGSVIMADETRVQVLKEPDKPVTSDKFMWVTLGGPPGEKSILFEYDPSRSGEVPLRLLDGFTGYLQTDGYTGYNAVCAKNGCTQLGCWDHARRKFKDAQDAQPRPKKGKVKKITKADRILNHINTLYLIERQIKELSIDEKYQQRQQRSLPVLNKLKLYLENNQHKVPKDSLTGKAMTYLSNQWKKLNVYCSSGELNISNILAENAIRPFVVGRKAWLFSDTPAGARASATHYSLIETARANGIEPYEYIKQVLTALPYAESVEDIEVLLPWNIKKSEMAK
ncbi:MAG: IS66 family transposase [Methylococcaceae bacterium]|nr:IS66 family transposase [Methylococcaceae bacterium]